MFLHPVTNFCGELWGRDVASDTIGALERGFLNGSLSRQN